MRIGLPYAGQLKMSELSLRGMDKQSKVGPKI